MFPRSFGWLLPLLVWTAACGPSDDVRSPDSTPSGEDSGGLDSAAPVDAGHTFTSVDWTLAVDFDGLTPNGESETGWRLDRADGAALEVTEAWLVVYVVTLETCADAAARARTALPPPPHGLPDHASATTVSHAVPLHLDAPVDAGQFDFGADAFCQVGLALFRGDTITENTPPDIDLNGVTLHVDGRMRTGADAEWQPIAYRSSLAGEADLLLPDGTASDPVHATVWLRPATLLDSLELTDDPDRVAYSMTKTLAQTAVVSLEAP